jgi:hypothetical protein
MIQYNVQTLIDYVKDLSGLTNASDTKIIRALNFAVDNLSILKQLAGGKNNPDSSNHDDLPRVTVTASTATLSLSGGDLDAGELLTLKRLELLVDGKYEALEPIDALDAGYTSLEGQTGQPTHFNPEGQIVRLYPQPDGSYTYRMSYGRVHPRYSADNLTQATGLLPGEEEYVALYATDRLMIGSNDPSRTQIRNELTVKAQEVRDVESKRDQSRPIKLPMRINVIE